VAIRGVFKTRRLVDINFLIKVAIRKSVNGIKLAGIKVKFGCESYKEAEGPGH
jgi:hypothetical protein